MLVSQDLIDNTLFTLIRVMIQMINYMTSMMIGPETFSLSQHKDHWQSR